MIYFFFRVGGGGRRWNRHHDMSMALNSFHTSCDARAFKLHFRKQNIHSQAFAYSRICTYRNEFAVKLIYNFLLVNIPYKFGAEFLSGTIPSFIKEMILITLN